MDERSIRTTLASLQLPAVYFFESLGSTNDLALQLAASGAPEGTLVIADRQTAGRGRFDRHWVTEPGSALAFSLVLRPSAVEREHLALFAPLCGLAVCRALEDLGLRPEIKWPNDVLIERRKTCGILVEAIWQDGTLAGLVAGIGVNVAPSAVPPEQEVLFAATCVESGLGQPVNRDLLLADILKALLQERLRLSSPQFLADWESRLAFLHEWVRVEQAENVLEGRIAGITPAGRLRLCGLDGLEFEVEVGDLRLRPVC
jgi:BirA family biotin operon repressor/biotin-[acetyl-CoA-carboxylase] ligase